MPNFFRVVCRTDRILHERIYTHSKLCVAHMWAEQESDEESAEEESADAMAIAGCLQHVYSIRSELLWRYLAYSMRSHRRRLI